jgi:hypothetical protein
VNDDHNLDEKGEPVSLGDVLDDLVQIGTLMRVHNGLGQRLADGLIGTEATEGRDWTGK